MRSTAHSKHDATATQPVASLECSLVQSSMTDLNLAVRIPINRQHGPVAIRIATPTPGPLARVNSHAKDGAANVGRAKTSPARASTLLGKVSLTARETSAAGPREGATHTTQAPLTQPRKSHARVPRQTATALEPGRNLGRDERENHIALQPKMISTTSVHDTGMQDREAAKSDSPPTLSAHGKTDA